MGEGKEKIGNGIRAQPTRSRNDSAIQRTFQLGSGEQEHSDWLTERAWLWEELLHAREDAQQARADRNHVLAQMREANERLVIASVRADEFAERADAGRHRAEILAAELSASEAAMCTSERQLRASEEQLRAALVAGKMAHWRWDSEAAHVVASGTLNEVLGLLPGKTLPSRIQEIFPIHPEDVQAHSTVVEAALRDWHGWQSEFRIVRPRDHQVAWLEESATCVVNAQNGKWDVVGVVRDITERKRAEEVLREKEEHTRALLSEAVAARSEAEAATRASDDFLTTVNHELRTPLAAILLWARALGTGLDPEESARAIEAITQSALSQSQLIEDLLELSRLTAGKFTLCTSAVDLAAVIADAVDMMQPMMAAKALVLNVEVEPASIVAVIDARRMKQILANTLGNAAKFTPPGGSVRLLVRAREARIDVELSDTGDGIAAEFLPHVFERFRQADMSDTRRHKGLGIGLAITKQLVELHGGTINVRSEGIGHGASFHIQLPWSKPESSSIPLAGNTGVSSCGRPLANVRILLVESDTNTRDAMRWTLSREGANVTSVATGLEALVVLGDSAAPDIIFSELGLPNISGFELIERVVERARQHGHRTPPSCAVSGHTHARDRRRAIEAGFDMFLAKPVAPEELLLAATDLREVLLADRDDVGARCSGPGPDHPGADRLSRTPS